MFVVVVCCLLFVVVVVFFFNDTATTEIYTLSLHDALPICGVGCARHASGGGDGCGEDALNDAVDRELDVGLDGHERCGEDADEHGELVGVLVVALGADAGDGEVGCAGARIACGDVPLGVVDDAVVGAGQRVLGVGESAVGEEVHGGGRAGGDAEVEDVAGAVVDVAARRRVEIGRASCRERV